MGRFAAVFTVFAENRLTNPDFHIILEKLI